MNVTSEDKNSMLYWYPKTCRVDVPQPETMLVHIDEDWGELLRVAEGMQALRNFPIIKHLADATLGFPVFVRTDQMAAKHSWKHTCFVEKLEDLRSHVAALVEHTLNCDIVGKMVRGIAVREYIEMESSFTAFDGLPISRERRYFVRDGKVECHHPYWCSGAIDFLSVGAGQTKGPPGWKDRLRCLNYESFDEIATLTGYAEKIAVCLEGYWSIDFCRCISTPERLADWYFIDCALGDDSWHPECEYKKD